MSFGRVLAITAVLVVIVAAVGQYDERIAWGLAIVTLLAILLHNSNALSAITELLNAAP